MNVRCTICGAVTPRGANPMRCTECGARPDFQVATAEAPRKARVLGGAESLGWEFNPDGPVLRRIK